MSNWGFFSAFDGERRIGGAVIVWHTPEVEMPENRTDLACLWDLRVHSEYRKRGVGQKLFACAVQWAQFRQCRQIKIETQNINVPACHFYARQGCELRGINRDAYGDELDEVQLLWYLDL